MRKRFAMTFERHKGRAVLLFFCAAVALLGARGVAAQEAGDPPAEAALKRALTAEEIASRMQERNHQREVALRKLEGTRVYRVRYHGFFGTREAEAVVSYKYDSPDNKQFTVISEKGTKFILDHVIKGLMEGEREAATEENRRRTALSSRNYDFTLADDDTPHEASEYVLNVIPKNDNKFLYRGKIWVDTSDFAVTRIEAEPAKSPSFWVKKSEVQHRYEKVGDFWLPAENKTDSTIRMGGHALLSIEYKDYRVVQTMPLQAGETALSKAHGE
jgi:outer membrane lipoprotein-sorting protein